MKNSACRVQEGEYTVQGSKLHCYKPSMQLKGGYIRHIFDWGYPKLVVDKTLVLYRIGSTQIVSNLKHWFHRVLRSSPVTTSMVIAHVHRHCDGLFFNLCIVVAATALTSGAAPGTTITSAVPEAVQRLYVVSIVHFRSTCAEPVISNGYSHKS